jgi:phage terminase large subunit GpA-like protein
MTLKASPEATAKLKRVIRDAFRRHFRAPPKLTLSEWADTYRKLSPEASAEPGQWYTDRVPYLRKPLDAAADPACEQAVFMFSSQSAKTEIILNALGYFCHQDPAPILAVEPRVEDCKALSKDRISPMLRDSPVLRGLVRDARTRDSGNTVLHKQFPGGHMTLAGANSAAGLSMRPIRVVLLDEVSRYPASAGTEGDPVSLAIKRTTTFWNRKVIMASSPAIEGACRITAAYEETDQQKFHIPCPACGEFQVLDWSRVQWVKDETDGRRRHRTSTARYHCLHCPAQWTDADRWGALTKGKWVADYPERTAEGRWGFWISQLYSPWKKLGELSVEFIDSRGNAEREKAFQNTVLGLPYRQKGEAPEWQRLYDRREEWPADRLPQGVVFLTAFTDVQKDRLETRVWGWGRGKCSWHIETRIMMGDTSRPDVWKELDELVGHSWRHESGGYLYLARHGIDSGYATNEVHAWAKGHTYNRAIVTKGDSRQSGAIGVVRVEQLTSMGKRAKAGRKVLPFNPNEFKEQFYRWLKLDAPVDGDAYPPGYVHLSKRVGDDEIKQLTAEQRVTVRSKGGFPKQEWQLVSGRRNEALDCRVGAHVMAVLHGIDSLTEAGWAKLEQSLDPKPVAKADDPPVSPAQSRGQPATSGPRYRSSTRDPASGDRNWLANDRNWMRDR